MEKYAIIVAGGIGKRMQSDLPKQFLFVEDEPIIVKTIRQFLAFDEHIKMIVVLPSDHFQRWHELKTEFLGEVSIQEVAGGRTRTLSVLAGLSMVNGEGLVAIHDAVRPFVSKETIGDSYRSAALHGSGVATVALKDSIREVVGESSTTRNRDNYRIVQTPQTFNLAMLKKAYSRIGDHSFTDDASVFEYAGNPVYLVEGSYGNIKITTPEDLY